MLLTGLLYFLGFFTLAYLSPTSEDGYTVDCLKCHQLDDKKINVHLVPHSHDDVGWLKTLDQYYYGLNNSIQYASVQYIITSVVDALIENPDRKYMQVETAFFWKWWNDQTTDRQKQFKKLVDNGQIEMVNGGWAMNDEACTNYQSTIDQFTWGLRLIDETVGSCGTPRVGWQIDPFGHSREQASVFSQLGFDGLFFARLDFADQATRRKDASCEYIWHGSSNFDADIFGGILPDGYGPPGGFCWDVNCRDDPIDDGQNPDNNVEEMKSIFTTNMQLYKTYYKTNNLLIPMGSDFHYSDAEANFINIDRLIKIYENDSALNVFYSTPSCYIRAVNDFNATFPEKFDDFFPYSNDDHSYWGGYFTSRPNSKRFERITHGVLQASKQLYAFASYNEKANQYDDNLRTLRESLGTIQHHDAITGTEKQHVTNDYVRQLSIGVADVEKEIGTVLKKLINTDKNFTVGASSCLLSNISICAVSQKSDKFIAAVYNPLGWNVDQYVRLPVDTKSFTISGPNGNESYEIVPAISDFSFVDLPGQKPSAYDLVFQAKNIPPLGFQIYYIEKTGKSDINEDDLELTATATYGWADNNFTVDTSTNLLKTVSLNGLTLNVQQNFLYYNSWKRTGGLKEDSQATSGAYLFRPDGTAKALNGKIKSTNFKGKLVQEFHQTWSDPVADITQIIRVYKDQSYIEFDWMVGSITTDDSTIGKEIISKFTITDAFDNNNTFYTDSNGREMIKRIKDFRPDYTYNTKAEPVASNYYPVTSKILIRDEKSNLELAVLNDRSQGGTSLNKGEIELMVHRRLFFDDWKGVDEPLNETEFGDTGVYVRGSHYLIFGQASGKNPLGSKTVHQERTLALKKILPPWVGLKKIDSSDAELDHIVNVSYSGLTKPLPENVNLLTFEPWKDDTYILRLENIFEKNEDPDLAPNVTVSLKDLFKNFEVTDCTETTLGANTELSDIKTRGKYSWKTKRALISPDELVGDTSTDIVLTPMLIRTFIVKLGPVDGSFALIIQPSVLLILCLLAFILRF